VTLGIRRTAASMNAPINLKPLRNFLKLATID
jgi:hypothetical protein